MGVPKPNSGFRSSLRSVGAYTLAIINEDNEGNKVKVNVDADIKFKLGKLKNIDISILKYENYFKAKQ